MLPRWIKSILAVLAVLSLLPFACIWKARNTLSPEPRIHIIQDMDNQAKYKPQRVNPLFADGRADRQPVPGTVARGQLRDDEALNRGIVDGQWTATVPIPLTETFLKRGQQRFEIYCSPCHGLSGYGDGPVAKRADRLQEGTWVPPLSFHSDQVRARPDGHVFNTITSGIRTMPAYGSQIPVEDRWAIVAYVRALERSQRADIADVPPEQRPNLQGGAR